MQIDVIDVEEHGLKESFAMAKDEALQGVQTAVKVSSTAHLVFRAHSGRSGTTGLCLILLGQYDARDASTCRQLLLLEPDNIRGFELNAIFQAGAAL